MSGELANPKSEGGNTQQEHVNEQGHEQEDPTAIAIRMADKMLGMNEDEEATEEKQGENESVGENKKQPETKEKPGNEEEKSADDKKEISASKAFAAIAEKEAKFQTKKRELETRVQEAERKAAETQALFDRLKKNPLAFLSELDLDLDTVLKAAANPEEPTKKLPDKSESAALEEVKRLRRELEERDRAKQEQEILTQFKGDISEHIAENEDKYPLILGTEKAQEQVFELIDGYYRQNGKVLPIEEAAEMVESELKTIADKWLENKYIQSKIAGLKANISDGESDKAKKKTGSASLSNSMSQSPNLADLTEEQRREMAIKAFGELSE